MPLLPTLMRPRLPGSCLHRRPRAALGTALFGALAALLPTASLAQALPAAPEATTATPAVPASELAGGLTADVFYRVLVGDVALQRGEVGLAARAFFEAAREARDARIARRAAEVALLGRQRMLAQESAKLWIALDPSAERPKQILAALVASPADKDIADVGDNADIRLRLEKLLADSAVSGQGVGEIFLQLNRFLAQQPERRQVLDIIRDLASSYPGSAEARFAVALAAFNIGKADAAAIELASKEIDRALEIAPGWERAALMKAELLARQATDAAIAYLKTFVAANPDARSASGGLAQFLVERKRYPEARAVFQSLWDRDRNAREFEFGVAVISVQMKDWPTAEALFLALKRANHGENGSVELYLAQIAEETGRYQDAIDRYLVVPDGERAWLAKLRVGAMMGKLRRVDEARQYLADLPAVTIPQRIQVRQAEAQLLRDESDHTAAHALLTKALTEHPDAPELLYDAAMTAEKLDRLDEAEARLRRVVELKPDDAQALNALGYTLVDRTARTSEGFALIERAHKLAPDDPFILDSLGWALYRMGRLDDAETYLRRAFAERPDAEIAAHLGEVLWAKGERTGAKEVWQSQLKTTPDHPVLLETVRRLAP
ncbi:MAG: tetratricopeptide repeat protein [Casimicrobiaceae bacterium]